MDQSWIIIMSLGLSVGVIGFLIVVGFIVYASIEMRKAAITFNGFLIRTEERMKPVLEEAEQSLKSIRNVSDDMKTVTENVKNFAGEMNEITTNLKVINNIANELKEGASLRVLGIKAGIRAALNVLIKEMSAK